MNTAAMVALYARVFSEQQSKRGTIDSQIAALKERISVDGAQIVEDMCFIGRRYRQPRQSVELVRQVRLR
jgi:site-specific DNA recombinase